MDVINVIKVLRVHDITNRIIHLFWFICDKTNFDKKIIEIDGNNKFNNKKFLIISHNFIFYIFDFTTNFIFYI